MGSATSTCEPTVSPQLLAQNELLTTFCGEKCNIKSEILTLPSGDINYVEITAKNKKLVAKPGDETTLVLAHGYGSGLGFFYPNYDALSQIFDKVISIDWLGMGSSSRTVPSSNSIPMKGWFNSASMTPTRAADFFIDNLEEFRAKKEITNFVLAGHSLGGYLSARYTMKYPAHVKGLVLVSPVGIPSHPPVENLVNMSDLPYKIQAIRTLWKANFTPQMYLRVVSEGKGLETVTGSLQRRFGEGKFTPEQLNYLSKYFYQITAAPACGEYALNSLLKPIISYKVLPSEVSSSSSNSPSPTSNTPTPPPPRRGFMPDNTSFSVYAREPLEKEFRENHHNLPPMLIMYGDNDWLCYDNIQASIKTWKGSSDGKSVDAKSVVVKNAGHHIYLDNPDEFHDYISNFQKKLYK